MSSTKPVVIIGALDTKGAEFAYLKGLIESEGVEVLVVDFGTMGAPTLAPDVSRAEVAAAAGGDIDYLASGEHKDEAMQTMAAGLAVVVRRLYDEGHLGGVIGMGGTGGTSIATTGMRTLPVGVPKVMVSTVAGGDVSAYAGARDITFIPSITDVAGINSISRAIYANAAGAIAGMVRLERPPAGEERPLVTASMFGNTTTCVERARGVVERGGYEVLVFHATGIGGSTMEALITDGYIAGSLDITTTELADYVCGGVFSAGPERCTAASAAGIPAVVVPGCVDMANFDSIDTVPDRYEGRNLYQWNPNVTLLRTNVEENIRIGEMLAAAVNLSTAPTAVLLPMRGTSMLDSEGERFWDPEADGACFDAIRNGLRADIPVHEIEHNINDPEFADIAANTLLELMQHPSG
ncbi:MAG: Tm-1-like ATP-binding domain-containing protein [bacterium]|nr:Tm-1-like ATP-binding domain-containing protein [bacterium]